MYASVLHKFESSLSIFLYLKTRFTLHALDGKDKEFRNEDIKNEASWPIESITTRSTLLKISRYFNEEFKWLKDNNLRL